MKQQTFLALTIVSNLLIVHSALAYTTTVNGIKWTYTVSNGQVTIKSDSEYGSAIPNSTSGPITIPSIINGHPVTSIGNYAFSGCSGLTSVRIPNSVTSIGGGAFYCCSGLTSVTIPNSVTSIGSRAFSGGCGLTSVTIPDSVTSIASYAFAGCSDLTTVTIGDSATSIESYAFSGCSSLTSVTIGDSVTSIGSYAFDNCSSLTSVTIPDSVTSIGSYAFSGCSGLSSVTIPDSVTSIGEEAFSGCQSSLFDMTTIPGVKLVDGWAVGHVSSLSGILGLPGIRGIGDYAFNGCSGFTSVTIPDSVTSIGNYAFSNCGSLTSVTIGNGVTSIGARAFYNCDGLTSMTIGNGVTSIGVRAFYNCNGLTSVTIPDSVTYIGAEAFSDCSGLTSVTIPDSVTSIGSYAFCNCSSALYATKRGVKLVDGWAVDYVSGLSGKLNLTGIRGICGSAFYNCSGLTSVTIPNSVTSIGAEAFSGCSGLTSVTIGNSVTTIGAKAFRVCSGLTSVTIPDSVVSIGAEAFRGCSGLSSVTIPDSVTSIGSEAFRVCNSLTSVTIPHSVTSIGSFAFYDCRNLNQILLHASYSGDTGWCPANAALKRYVQVSFNPNGGTMDTFDKTAILDAMYGELPLPSLENHAFKRWELNGETISSDTIVGTVSNHTLVAKWDIGIGGGAWEFPAGEGPITLGAPLVAPAGDVVVPSAIDDRPIVAISSEAFGGNTNITSVSIPQGITAIPDNFFAGCTALRAIDIPESVVEIGTNVFDACSALETVNVDGLKVYQGWVLGFADGAAVPADLVVPENYTAGEPPAPRQIRGIAAGAFEGEYGIETVTLPESLRFIGARAFANCINLENVIVPDGVWKIDRDAFRNCTYAQGLALPESLRAVGDGAFANCTSLMGVELPDGVEEVGGGAFSNCWRMISVSIPQSVERVGAGAFADCRRIIGATVPLHIAPMAELFPAAYDKLATVTVASLDDAAGEPPAPRQMVSGIFAGCVALEGIALPGWVRNVLDGAFEGCASISSLSFPDSITNIGARACASMAALGNVKFPAGVVSIGEEAFDGDDGIASLALPDGLRAIGARAFRGLSLLARADIPASVREIGAGAFTGCGAIRAVTLPGDAGTVADVFPDAYASIVSATVVSGGAARSTPPGGSAATPLSEGGNSESKLMTQLFAGCSALTRVELPQELAAIGDLAFSGCSSLAEVGIPAAVTNLGASAFASCTTLSSIALPKNLAVISDGTFSGCSSLTEITVPESVGRIGNGIFTGCSNLRSVRFVGNAPSYSTADGGPYGGVPAGAVSYVANGSTGWDGIPMSKALPEFWPNGTTYEIAFWTPNRYNVSFDPCLGGAAPIEVVQVTGTSYVFPSDPVRQGATFGGWWTSIENGARITASTLVTATRPHTYYAHWTMNRYYIHLDANGGSGTSDPIEMAVGTTAALPSCPFAYVAHAFAGWATTPDGAVVYADGATVADLAYANNAAVTLYAVWVERDWSTPDYLDAPGLAFETEGGGEWECDWQDFKTGGASLRSGELPPSELAGQWTNTTLRATVLGEGSLSFWWKVSCEENDEDYGEWYDFATFAVDGVEVARIAGERGWRQVECSVTGAGAHILEWSFWRDDYDEDGANYDNALWLDGVEWTPAPVTLSFAAGVGANGENPMGEAPAAVTKFAGYELVLPGCGTLANAPYVFTGWTDGESTYTVGETFVFGSANTTLTAVWTLKTWTLAEAVDAADLVFTTGGTTSWAVDAATGWTNGVSAKSGAVANGEASWIETAVAGPGTLTFRWNVMGGIYRTTPFAYAKVEVDGANMAQTHLTDGWASQTLEIAGSGQHTIRWTYLRTSARTAEGDCAWLDGVAWEPASIVATETTTTPEPVPYSWLDADAAPILAEHGGNYEAAAHANAANGVNKVWECYVAGLSPTNATDVFRTVISMDGEGRPVITWEPDLNEGGTKSERIYRILGARSLAAPVQWSDVTDIARPGAEGYRFFKVTVEMP